MSGAEMPPARVAWKATATFASLVLAVGSLTVLFLCMRAVMDIGGVCASGSPYPNATTCPAGTGWMTPLSIWTGLLGVGLYVAARSGLPGPQWWALAWPALFLSLGYNFCEYGLADGIEWGSVICGLLFVLMGGIPLALMLSSPEARHDLLWAEPAGSVERATPREILRTAAPTFRPTRASGAVVAAAATAASSPDTTAVTAPAADLPLAGSGVDDMAEDLWALAELHREGELSDEEFRDAKVRRIGGST